MDTTKTGVIIRDGVVYGGGASQAANVTYDKSGTKTSVQSELDVLNSDIDTLNENLAQTPITKGDVTLSTIDDKLNYLIENGTPGNEFFIEYMLGICSSNEDDNKFVITNNYKNLYIGSFTIATQNGGTFKVYGIKNGVVTNVYSSSVDFSNVTIDISEYDSIKFSYLRINGNHRCDLRNVKFYNEL